MTGASGQGGNVVYLGGDAGLAGELRTRLVERVGFAAFPGVGVAAQAMQAVPGSVLVLDARSGSSVQDIPKVLAKLEAACGSPPTWVCLGDQGDISTRLHALRGKAQACFSGAGTLEELCARLLALTGVAADAPYRVLVVDDQEVASLFATRVLEKEGMEVRAVDDALTVLDALEDMHPDLVLMDLHMPGASGIELTRIIREHEEFFGLPVVFLSAEGDPDRQLDTLRVGGDDFLAKPVPAERLVETVRRRIEGARQHGSRGAGTGARDAATGLWSRGYLLHRIDNAIAGGASKTRGTGVLYLEIDQARELEGHPGLVVGVLAEVGRVLRAGPYTSSLAARVGPVSLGLLIRGTDVKSLLVCAEGLRGTVAGQNWAVDGGTLRLTASIGIGLFTPHADDAITMIARAKKACSKARRAGGNRCEVYTSALPAEGSQDRANRMVDLIREALDGDGLVLSYQPVVSLRQRAGERYEALLRLRTPDGELIPPGEFLPVARKAGLMREIDLRVLTRALDEMVRRRAAHQGLQLLIRQTLATAAAPGWADWLRDQVAQRDLVRQRPALVFDLDDVTARPQDAKDLFASLRRLGIDLCLNRLTDSPAALRALTELPVSLVRLDPSALVDLDHARLTTLVEAVHQCGAMVVATGIEDPRAIAQVWGCRVDFIHGNFVQPASQRMDFDFAGTELF